MVPPPGVWAPAAFDAVKRLVLCRVEKNPPKLDVDPYLPKANVSKTSAMTSTPTPTATPRSTSP